MIWSISPQAFVHDVPAASFRELYDEIHAQGRLHKPQRWRLRLRQSGELIYFDGMLGSLLRWARAEGLLRGQRNRHLDGKTARLCDPGEVGTKLSAVDNRDLDDGDAVRGSRRVGMNELA